MATTTHIGKQDEAEIEKSLQLRSADPAAPVENQYWINKTQNKLKYFNGSVVKELHEATINSTFPSEGFRSYVSEANKITPANTEIEGRKQILDDSNSLKLAMGTERVVIDSVKLIEDEFGPNGEPVYEPNNRDERIRFVGKIGNFSDNQGTYAALDDLNDFCEVTFYGTGLNILTLADSTRDLRVTIDGGAESGNVMPSGLSGVLNSRNIKINSILNVASGLSLGIHTVKLRQNSGGQIQRFYGVEIL